MLTGMFFLLVENSSICSNYVLRKLQKLLFADKLLDTSKARTFEQSHPTFKTCTHVDVIVCFMPTSD